MTRGALPDHDAGDGSAPPGLDPRVHDAVTDLHTYAMFLEAQAPPRDAEAQDEVGALRATTAALQELGSVGGDRR
jgi:hypothetical protein